MNKIIFILLLVLPVTAYSEVKAPLPVALHLFAHSQAELNDKRGRYLKTVPPIMEYRKFTKWDSSEISSSPDKFDAIAIISNNNYTDKDVSVHFEVSAKVGRLVVDKQVGVTDIEHGLSVSQWKKPEINKIIKIDNLSQKHAHPAVLKDINIKNIQDKYYKEGEWPFQIKVRAWLSCSKCDSNEQVETIIDVMPGD